MIDLNLQTSVSDGKRRFDLDVRLATNAPIVALYGPSGAGKSLTLQCIAGLLPPHSGHIRVAGRTLYDAQAGINLSPAQRRVGYLFQDYALFPHLSVRDNVAFGLTSWWRRRLSPAQAQRVDAMLDSFGLLPMAHSRPAHLSGGQQQRVALARALVFEPKLVLMDEPLGALDKQLREHMQIELKELHHQLGLTFVYVTHDQSEALTMSDRVAVFNDGVIQQLAGVEDLYEAPTTRFVAGFVGDSTVLRGKLTAANTLTLTDGRVLQGVNVTQGAVGSLAEACVRPERIVWHSEARADHPNYLAATVTRVIYHGDHLRLLCDLGPGQPEATVKLPLTREGSNPHPHPGDAVALEFPPASTRLYAV